MFKCGVCGTNSKKGERASHALLEKRSVNYRDGGQGWEIVREVLAHAACAANADGPLTVGEVNE